MAKPKSEPACSAAPLPVPKLRRACSAAIRDWGTHLFAPVGPGEMPGMAAE